MPLERLDCLPLLTKAASIIDSSGNLPELIQSLGAIPSQPSLGSVVNLSHLAMLEIAFRHPEWARGVLEMARQRFPETMDALAGAEGRIVQGLPIAGYEVYDFDHSDTKGRLAG